MKKIMIMEGNPRAETYLDKLLEECKKQTVVKLNVLDHQFAYQNWPEIPETKELNFVRKPFLIAIKEET